MLALVLVIECPPYCFAWCELVLMASKLLNHGAIKVNALPGKGRRLRSQSALQVVASQRATHGQCAKYLNVHSVQFVANRNERWSGEILVDLRPKARLRPASGTVLRKIAPMAGFLK